MIVDVIAMFVLSLLVLVFLYIPSCLSDRFWDDLKVANRYTLGAPTKLPRTYFEALAQGWTKQDNVCGGNKGYQGYASVDKRFNGALAVLMDENGHIAGFQSRISDVEAEDIGVTSRSLLNPFVKDASNHPKICDKGRTIEEFEAQGTGTGLYIQNGDKQLIMKIEKNEKDVTQPWVQGGCLPLVGQHYWYDIHSSMACKDLFPVVPFYNGQDLNGFGIAYNDEIQKHIYSCPTGDHMNMYMTEVPQCFKNPQATISMYYVFLTSNLWLNFC